MNFFFRRITENRWFSVIDLISVASGILWIEIFPGVGGIALIIALLPWALRLLARSPIFLRSLRDIFPIIFLATAWMSTDSAYDPQNSFSKLFFLVGGVLLYFSFLHQSNKNLWLMAFLISVAGAVMSCFFLLANDWQVYPAKIGWINQIGLWWMKVRPEFLINRIYHNSAAGVIALTLPFTIIIGMSAWQKKSLLAGIWTLIIAAISLIGLMMTTSRGAVLALFFGFLIWMIWLLMRNHFLQIHIAWMKKMGPAIILGVFLLAGILLLFLAGPVSLVPNISALSDSGSRLGLYTDSIRLIQDFPIIGAGLNSFSGLYSNYILNIPFLFYENSHNLYVNVAIEQGIIGSLLLICIYFICIRDLAKNEGKENYLLIGATLASLAIIVLHNLVDNVIDEGFLTPIIFVIPGFARSLVAPKTGKTLKLIPSRKLLLKFREFKITRKMFFIAMSVLTVIVAIFLLRFNLLSTLYSNLGAVRMAKVELAGFPMNGWDSGQNLPGLAFAEADFLQSLQYNSNNRTANHRLGLIAMLRRDYPTAIYFLEKAYQADPGHRGVWKSLGYSYVWNGQYALALPLLQKIPESQQEMETYTWWWTTQNRADLSDNAALMASRLKDTAALSSQ
jgi:O-antigen ligase